MRTRRIHPVLAGALLVVVGAATAQQPRGIPAQPLDPDAQTNCFERVVAPSAEWCLVNEVTNVLVVGHAPGLDRQISLFPLDESGRVITSAPPVAIALPVPASLASRSNVAVAAAVHPSLPLLYVLQDIVNTNGLSLDTPATNPVFRDLDRLLVYELAPAGAKLLASVRGDWFRYGYWGTGYPRTLAVDPVARRLYLPALRTASTNNPENNAIGYLDLDDRGLPVARDGRVAPAGLLSTDPVTAVTGYGWMIYSTNRVVCGGAGAVIFWDQSDRASPCESTAPGPYHPLVIAGHPNQQILYAAYIRQTMYAVELADGRPTLQPRGVDLFGYSLPVVMAQRQRLAFGAPDRVALLHLGADGALTGAYNAVPVPGFAGWALYYSLRFDRLYIVVEPKR